MTTTPLKVLYSVNHSVINSQISNSRTGMKKRELGYTGTVKPKLCRLPNDDNWMNCVPGPHYILHYIATLGQRLSNPGMIFAILALVIYMYRLIGPPDVP